MNSLNAGQVKELWSVLLREVQNFAGLPGLSGLPHTPTLRGIEIGSGMLARQIGYENFLAKVGETARFIRPDFRSWKNLV